MTRTSIKIIYLTLLWTLTCPFLQCFSLLSPLNYITLLTSIQSLQAISLKVSEESYDLINKALKNNPNLIKRLITESGSSKSKLSPFPLGVPVVNGISSIFPLYGKGMYSVKNPVAVALPKEVVSNGQKYVLTNRLNILGNFFKKVTSAIASPISSSLNYLNKSGQNQGVLPDVLKSISNRLKVGDGNKEFEEEGEEDDDHDDEEEKQPKKSKKDIKKKKAVKEEDDEEEGEDEDEEEEEKLPKKSKKDKKKKKAEKDEDEDEEEEKDEGDEDEEGDEEGDEEEEKDTDDEEEKDKGDEDEEKDTDDEEEKDKGDEDEEDEDEDEDEEE